MGDIYSDRLDALEQTWQVWAGLGRELRNDQWSAASRCPGWDVAALYAHHSMFPVMLNGPPPQDSPATEPVTAADILRGFNTTGGVAHTMASTVAEHAVSDAAAHSRQDLVDRFGVHGPAAVRRLRAAEPGLLVPWPVAQSVVPLVEVLRIVLMEATVHLLDVQRALGRPPHAPAAALAQTVGLLAELAPAVDFIEAATGRSAQSPLPVLR